MFEGGPRADASCSLGHERSAIVKYIYEGGLRDWPYGFVFVESKGVMVGEVGACDDGGLGVDLGVHATPCVGACARDAQRRARGRRSGQSTCERVLLVHPGAGGGHVIKACEHAVEFVWFLDGCGKWSQYE